jgi:hypothetical protein
MYRRALPIALVLLTLGSLTQLDRQPSESPPAQESTQETLLATLTRNAGRSVDHGVNGDRPITDLEEALHRGRPITLTLGQGERNTFIFRPRRSLTENFRIGLGTGDESLPIAPHVFEGLALDSRNADSTATLAVTGNTIGAVVRHESGDTTYIRTDPVSGELQAVTQNITEIDNACAWDAQHGHYQLHSDDPLADGESFWTHAVAAQIAPDAAALTGIDPSTGNLDKYINRIPRATNYDASLKDALMLLVLDKEATGSNNEANLASKASLFLATISNIAAVYENQLGIRLLVQEMIMIPDTGGFVDIPSRASGSDSLDNFRTWLQTNRRNSTFQWSMAAKFGAGLDGTTLGIAYVDAIRNNSAVSVCRSTARWDVLAHEMGHNLGSEHSQGGIMNSTSGNGNNRSFFTEVTAGETSTKDIYDYAKNRLYGSVNMRHPEEIPFANQDSESTLINIPVTFSPLNNDDEQVLNGIANALALEEVGQVTPRDAGIVTILGKDLRFTPATDFEGTAWFSYTLRGNIGNSNEGWLHKADIAISVNRELGPLTITLAPGASYSFMPSNGTSGVTQPAQALVDRSRDNSNLLIIRVHADANGSETFRAGGRTFTLDYTAPAPKVTNDRYVYVPGRGSLSFNPLLNDEGAGEAWINPIKPTIGVGTTDHDSDGNELFPTTFRLVSASNRDPGKGTLTTRTLPFIVDGQRINQLDSTLTFTPRNGATGTATIDYTVVDAAGIQSSAIIEIILPFRVDTLLESGASVCYIVPSSNVNDTTWMLPEFDASEWTTGVTGLG